MTNGLVESIKATLSGRPSHELLTILTSNDRAQYADEAFAAVRAVLEERNERIPAHIPGTVPPPTGVPPRDRRFAPDLITVVVLGAGLCITTPLYLIWLQLGYTTGPISWLAIWGLLPYWCCLAAWIIDGLRPADGIRRGWLRFVSSGVVVLSWVILAVMRYEVGFQMRLDVLDMTAIPGYCLLGLVAVVVIPWVHRKSE